MWFETCGVTSVNGKKNYLEGRTTRMYKLGNSKTFFKLKDRKLFEIEFWDLYGIA